MVIIGQDRIMIIVVKNPATGKVASGMTGGMEKVITILKQNTEITLALVAKIVVNTTMIVIPVEILVRIPIAANTITKITTGTGVAIIAVVVVIMKTTVVVATTKVITAIVEIIAVAIQVVVVIQIPVVSMEISNSHIPVLASNMDNVEALRRSTHVIMNNPGKVSTVVEIIMIILCAKKNADMVTVLPVPTVPILIPDTKDSITDLTVLTDLTRCLVWDRALAGVHAVGKKSMKRIFVRDDKYFLSIG